MTKEKIPLMTWREPPEATALRAMTQLTWGPFGHGPMMYEDEGGRRMNWAAIIGVLSWLIFEIKPWRFRKYRPETIVLVVGAIVLAYLILRRIRIPQRLTKLLTRNVFGKSKPPTKSALITVFAHGIKIDNVFIPWRTVSRYRIRSHAEKPDLRGVEIRRRSFSGPAADIFIGFYPKEIDESQLRRLLFDLHPLGYWENVEGLESVTG